MIDESVPQVAGPLDVIVHLVDDIRNSGDGFDIVVPGLGIEFGDVIGVFHESRRLNDLQRIGGCRQQSGQEWIWKKSDRADQFIQIRFATLSRC